MVSIKTFIKNYTKELTEDNVAVFAGAGLSVASGFVSWRELLRDIAEEMQLDIDKESDLVAIAQYHLNENKNRGLINQKIIDKFTSDSKINDVHRILSRLPIHTYWTTNYDSLIEDSLHEANKKVDKKIDPQSLAVNVPMRDVVVYKMHGDVLIPSDAVITKDDYETYNEKRQLFTAALQGDLVSKTFLFIGFSFEDPNLSFILSRIRVLLGENKRTHYAFFKKIIREDYSSTEDFSYAEIRQRHRLEDLKRYSIAAVLIDSYSEIPQILKTIESSINLRNIFISGSAHEYGEWTPESAHELIQSLTERLVMKNMRIVSGFGLGVGSFVINSAVQVVDQYKNSHYSEFIKINPFPFQLNQDQKIVFNVKYREGILDQCGIAIFMFGNKMVNGKLAIADGVLEEFRIAVEKKLFVIPIGSTGFAALEIFRKIKIEIDQFPYLTEYQEILQNKKDPKVQVETVMAIINKIIGG